MSEAEEVKLEIKIVLNKEKTKLLFAEAGRDFADYVLFGFLFLPLGRIVKLLEMNYGDEAPVIGSFNTLYNGLANLDSIHFQYEAKEKLLNPKLDFPIAMSELWLNINCTNITSSDLEMDDYKMTLHITEILRFDKPSNFVISDDLRVLPNGARSIIETLSFFGLDLVDMDDANTSYVTFRLNEIIDLLKASLVSQNPLSALLLGQNQVKCATVNSEQGNVVLNEEAISANNKKMVLNVMLQKSSNKLLFAQADHEFVNFLFGLLTISLGKVGWYLDSETGLQNVTNLCKSNEFYSFTSSNTSNAFSPLNFDPKQKQLHVSKSRMYMVTDDLTVSPLDLCTGLSVLNGLKISLSEVKEIDVQVGLEEGLNILKAALTSTTALTDGLIKPMLEKQSKRLK